MAKEILTISGIILVLIVVILESTSTTIQIEDSPEESMATVSRYLTLTVPRGGSFNVTLTIDLNESNPLGEILIREHIPLGWAVTSSSPKYTSFDSKNGTVRWVLWGGELFDRNITYTVQVPANATGSASFFGEWGYSVLNNISGDIMVQIEKDAVTAKRTLPEKANAGSRVNVSIALDVNESNKPNSVIIKDYFPTGWNISSSEPSANSFNSTTGEIKWIFFGESVSDRIISYVLEIPPGVLGNNTFSGEFMYLDQWNSTITCDIMGDAVINVEKKCLVRGDANCDDEVSDFEILDYVNKWANGEVSDFDLLEAIENWAKG